MSVNDHVLYILSTIISLRRQHRLVGRAACIYVRVRAAITSDFTPLYSVCALTVSMQRTHVVTDLTSVN